MGFTIENLFPAIASVDLVICTREVCGHHTLPGIVISYDAASHTRQPLEEYHSITLSDISQPHVDAGRCIGQSVEETDVQNLDAIVRSYTSAWQVYGTFGACTRRKRVRRHAKVYDCE